MHHISSHLRATTRLALLALAAGALLVSSATAASPTVPPGTPTARTFHGIKTVGALFPSATSTHHFCTASVVRSPQGDVLLTAAHCIRGTGAGLSFAPGFHGGVAPYGRWTVTAAYLDRGWLTHQDTRRDFAFLLVAPRTIRGRRTEIQQVIGGTALGLRARAGERVTIPAHPAGSNNRPITCTVPLYYDGVYPAFNCNPYPGGTSGSPWLAHTRLGATVVALIGGLHQGGCYTWTSYSPPFGIPVLRTYERAARHAKADVAPTAGSDGC